MRRTAALGCIAVFFAIILCGCRLIRIEEEPRKPLEYTIVKQEMTPKELLALIEEKKEKEFQLTYQMEGSLYLVKGYGQQVAGGCSIQVEEVSLSSDAIYFKTRLMGPKQPEGDTNPSYPYIVIKTDFRKEPVEFV